MTEPTYRFMDIGLSLYWGVFHAASGIRVPGLVKKDFDKRLYVFERQIGRSKLVKLEAPTVAELREKVKDYYDNLPPVPPQKMPVPGRGVGAEMQEGDLLPGEEES